MSREPRESRRSKRVHRRQAAWIVLDGGMTELPCVLWDVSDGGARIAAARASLVPDAFDLFLSKDGKSHRFCRVAWRRGGYLGVQFVDHASAIIDRAPDPASMRRKPADLAAVARTAHAQDIDTRIDPRIDMRRMMLPGYGADVALKDDAPPFRWSVLARGMLYAMIAATGVFFVAGIESQADWSTAICAKAENFCRHPEWAGGAAIMMLLIYLALSGMEG